VVLAHTDPIQRGTLALCCGWLLRYSDWLLGGYLLAQVKRGYSQVSVILVSSYNFFFLNLVNLINFLFLFLWNWLLIPILHGCILTINGITVIQVKMMLDFCKGVTLSQSDLLLSTGMRPEHCYISACDWLTASRAIV